MSRTVFGTTVVVALSSVLFVACGGSSDEDFIGGGTSEVTEIDTDENVIPLREGAVFRVNFAFNENEVFFDDGNVHLVVRLPEGLEFRPDSAEIDGLSGDDEDVTPAVFTCSSGESFLAFNFDRFDLNQANSPGDNSDAQLKFTVDASQRGENVLIEARADEGAIPFGCRQVFIPDEQQVVSIR